MINNNILEYSFFARNFRGMPSGWQTLERVNFLVGENSTGKTSYLQLLEILDSPQFIMLGSATGIIDGIESAFDVISRRAGGQSATIGFCYIEKSRTKSNDSQNSDAHTIARGKMVDYLEVDDKLRVRRVSTIVGKKLISIRGYSDQLRSRAVNIPDEKAANSHDLAQWMERQHKTNSGYKTLDGFSNLEPDDMQWLAALAVVAESEGSKSEAIPFSRSPLRCFQYGPMRGKPRRMYYGSKYQFSSSGEHVPYIIKDRISKADSANDAIALFGKESGLFDAITVVSVRTRINDRPFAIQIEKNGKHFYIDELGFGVGQILPIVADISFSPSSVGFLIQQPELHLHPRAQASFGEFLYTAAAQGHFFVIETHSDFLIDRFRLAQNKDADEERVSAQIVFMEPAGDSAGNRATQIKLSGGQVVEPPDNYRAFFLAESLEYFEHL